VADERLYRPLGMASTSSRHADFLARADQATLHIKAAGAWTPSMRDADPQSPAGGVSSAARDLAQWLRLELADGAFDGKPLIGVKAMAETHTPITARGTNPVTGSPSFYAIGWNVEYSRHGLTWSHAGAFSAGVRTTAVLYPESHLGIVVLANAFPTGVPEGIADSFSDLVFDGQSKTDWITPWNKIFDSMLGPSIAAAQATFALPPASPTPAMAPAAYEGRYSSPCAGDALVESDGGALVLKVGPGGARAWRLRHYDRDLFVYFPDTDMPDRPSTVSFNIGADGQASSVSIESLNGRIHPASIAWRA